MHTTGERASFALTTADLTTRFDPQPRIRDVRIGERLGLARPTNIRKLIEANRHELDRYGSLHAVRAMIKAGKGAQRETTEYYLNEPQTLLLCMFSRTGPAADVREELIHVFMAYRQGLTSGVSNQPNPTEDPMLWQGLPVYTYTTLARALGVRGGSLRFAASYHRRNLKPGREYIRLYGPDVQDLVRNYPGCGLSPRATQTTLWTPAGAQFLAAHVRQGLHDPAPSLPYSGLATATLTVDGLTAQEQALILFIRHLASAGGLLPR